MGSDCLVPGLCTLFTFSCFPFLILRVGCTSSWSLLSCYFSYYLLRISHFAEAMVISGIKWPNLGIHLGFYHDLLEYVVAILEDTCGRDITEH